MRFVSYESHIERARIEEESYYPPVPVMRRNCCRCSDALMR